MNLRFWDASQGVDSEGKGRPNFAQSTRMRERVEACYRSIDQQLFAPDGRTLHLRLPRPSETSAPAVYINVHPPEPSRWADSANYREDIPCKVILHETLHLLGLSDAYPEEESSAITVDRNTGQVIPPGSARSCRVLGHSKWQSGLDGTAAVIALLAILLTTAWASDRTPLLIQAEHTGPAGTEQATLIFEKDRVRFASNSNFLEKRAQQTALGVFESAYNPALAQAQAEIRALAPGAALQPSVRHGVRIYLGSNLLAEGSPAFERALALLSLTPTDGSVRVPWVRPRKPPYLAKSWGWSGCARSKALVTAGLPSPLAPDKPEGTYVARTA